MKPPRERKVSPEFIHFMTLPTNDLRVRAGRLGGMSPLILHVPHASGLIPAADREDFLLSDGELAAEGRRLVDAHTDALFGADCWPGAVLAAKVSRLVVDVERFADDAREPCARVGMGATYVRTTEGRPLRDLSAARRAALLESYYVPHHAAADRLARERLAARGRCLVLDAHSYPLLLLLGRDSRLMHVIRPKNDEGACSAIAGHIQRKIFRRRRVQQHVT